MPFIETIEPKPVKGQRFATNILFHGGDLEKGEGILTVESILKDAEGNRIEGTVKSHNVILKDLIELDPQLSQTIDKSLRLLCDKVWEPKEVKVDE